MKISTNFLIEEEGLVFLPFDKKQTRSFNYVRFEDQELVSNDIVKLQKQKTNSARISIDTQDISIKELKLTNQNILTWDDLWIDNFDGSSIDPMIESINLQRNSFYLIMTQDFVIKLWNHEE